MTVPFARAWWSFELRGIRPCDDTYEKYPFDSVPPLDEALFVGRFQWLEDDDDDGDDDDFDDLGGDDDDPDDDDPDDDDPDDDPDDDEPGDDDAPSQAERLATLVASLATVGLKLPEPFVRFMGDEDLQAAVPSCTACEWDLSEALIESPFEDDAWLVRFLRDQQDCLFWYLHVTPTGSYVLCSPIPFDDPELDEPPEVLRANTWWCAPHFEHFVYRFWMENLLWELLEAKGARLNEAQTAYVGHYAPRRRG